LIVNVYVFIWIYPHQKREFIKEMHELQKEIKVGKAKKKTLEEETMKAKSQIEEIMKIIGVKNVSEVDSITNEIKKLKSIESRLETEYSAKLQEQKKLATQELTSVTNSMKIFEKQAKQCSIMTDGMPDDALDDLRNMFAYFEKQAKTDMDSKVLVAALNYFVHSLSMPYSKDEELYVYNEKDFETIQVEQIFGPFASNGFENPLPPGHRLFDSNFLDWVKFRITLKKSVETLKGILNKKYPYAESQSVLEYKYGKNILNSQEGFKKFKNQLSKQERWLKEIECSLMESQIIRLAYSKYKNEQKL
jgi:hypothetical protein